MDDTSRIGRTRLLWAIPIAMAVHNLEEALGFRWLAAHARLPEAWLRVWGGSGGATWRFDAALLLTVLVVLTIAARSSLGDPRSRGARVLVVVQMLMLVNAFWHVTATVLLRGYAPGVITAVLVNLPLALLVLVRNRQERWLSPRAVALALTIVFVLHALPVLLLGGELRA